MMMITKAAGFKYFRRDTLIHLLTWLMLMMKIGHRKYYYKVIVITLTIYAAATTVEARR
jgi:hypothetical protein